MVLTIATVVFSLTIAALSTTQSIVLSMYILLPMLVFVCIWGGYRKQYRQYCVISVAAIVLGICSVALFFNRYNKTAFVQGQEIVITNASGYQSLIATGTIIEKQTHNRYLWKAHNQAIFFLYTNTQYNPGDSIWLTANATLSADQPLSLLNNYTDKKQKFLQQWSDYRFDFASRQIMKKVSGSLYEKRSLVLGQGELTKMQQIRFTIKKQIINTFSRTTDRGLIAGMVLGDRSLLAANDYQLFIDSGIVHIIAVSGAHMVSLIVFLHLILFFVPFYRRVAIIIPCIVVYAMVCGLDGSVMRAAIMGSLSLFALFVGRQSSIRRSLSIAYIVMLLINPFFLVYDIGFVFSFAAVIGIVYMTQWTKNIVQSKKQYYSRMVNYIVHKYVFPSFGATMTIVPFLLFFTGKFNLTGILSNILIFPLIPFVMIGGALSTLLQGFVFGSWLLWLVQRGIIYIYAIASFGQKYAIFVVSQGQRFMYTLIAIVITLFVIDKIKENKGAV